MNNHTSNAPVRRLSRCPPALQLVGPHQQRSSPTSVTVSTRFTARRTTPATLTLQSDVCHGVHPLHSSSDPDVCVFYGHPARAPSSCDHARALRTSARSAEGLEVFKSKVKVDVAAHRGVRRATYKHRTPFCLVMCIALHSMEAISGDNYTPAWGSLMMMTMVVVVVVVEVAV